MTWQRNGSSNRRLSLPRNWYTELRPAVIRRDRGRCVQCGEPGNQVDHIGDRDNHNLSNLRLLCIDHHKQHTAQQAAEGIANRAAKRRRRTEPTPGLTPPGGG